MRFDLFIWYLVDKKQVQHQYQSICKKIKSTMLANLDEMSKQMKTLIQTINKFEKQISTPYEAKKSNFRNSIIVKLPKYILLTKILTYLTYRQCHYLSKTCVFIRRTIYSPLGWKIMNQIHSPYQTVIVDPQMLQASKLQGRITFSSEAEDHLEDYEDEKFLIKQRAKYKESLWAKYKLHLSLKQKNQVLEEKVRIQKMFLFKTKLEKTFFQIERDDLDQQNTKFKQKLKKICSDFLIRDQKMAKRILQIDEENSKLQKQKQALVYKIKEYQQEIPKLAQKVQVSKRTLKLLKEFVETKEYEPLQKFQE